MKGQKRKSDSGVEPAKRARPLETPVNPDENIEEVDSPPPPKMVEPEKEKEHQDSKTFQDRGKSPNKDYSYVESPVKQVKYRIRLSRLVLTKMPKKSNTFYSSISYQSRVTRIRSF